MSLTTAFPFRSYEGDLRTRRLMQTKLGLFLSLLTSEDMASMAFVEVRVRCGQEDKAAPWQPVRKDGELAATFYDSRMGNFNVRTFPVQPCTTCTNSHCGRFGNERCQGHFGFIRMPRRQVLTATNAPSTQGLSPHAVLAEEQLYVINPHLSDEVEQLLQAKCFFCHRFRATVFDAQRYIQALRLLDAGLIGEARRLLEVVANARGQEARNRRRRDANEEVIGTVGSLQEYADRILHQNAHAGGSSSTTNGSRSNLANHHDFNAEANEEAVPLSASLDIRNSLCKQALAELKEHANMCSHCGGISPRITTKNGHLFFFFNKKNAEINVAKGLLGQRQLADWAAFNELQGRTRTYFPTSLVREHIKQLCQHEYLTLQAIFQHLGEPPVSMPYKCPLPPNLFYKVFFIDKLLVPSLPLRLSSGVQVTSGGAIAPDNLTRALSDVLGFVDEIEKYYVIENKCTLMGQTVPNDKVRAHEQNLQNLQSKVTAVYGEMLDSFAKKEGLFRMYMMGKRVNQACRSVISPDCVVEPNEILLPRPFARRLSFPEKVPQHSPVRAALLQRCVLNGPHIYPGATHLEIHLPGDEIRFVDLNVNEQSRRQHARKYFAMLQSADIIVYRHILDGDRLVFNRQPTLHKVSMLGYRAKVLSGLKTLRFHYVNGKSYNADFDGDEMNIHVPQSIETKAELSCLMDANLHYLVPTSGRPIRGLIQDHIVAGVLLTLRDKLLSRETFVQYLYCGLAPYLHRPHRTTHAGGNGPLKEGDAAAPAVGMRSVGLSCGGSQTDVTLTHLLPIPALLKPRPLWTGKQLISALVRYVTGVVHSREQQQQQQQNHGVSLSGISLIQPSAFNSTNAAGELVTVPRSAMDDDRVLFLNSELLTGVLCKNQLGPSNFSVTHIIHDIYGPHMVGELFGALGRTLTASLQREGFSMGMDDMCLTQESRREALLRELDNAPLALPDDEAVAMPAIMNLTSKIQKEFVPGRMLVPFPANQLLMMTLSGAKGSNTNTIQMALGLGQQLFDGRRVRRMNSGKTLPCFFIGERRARSFGYAMGRFTSGIRPGEYTIHAMAGRDGLIDTAVKTSRSGHLQRCLIKAMESLVVHWDHSVRNANGSVVQFVYGGDGLDPMKTGTLQAWAVAKDNIEDLRRKYGCGDGEADAAVVEAKNELGKRLRPAEDDDEAAAVQKELQRRHCAAIARDPLPPHITQSLQEYLESKATFPLFRKVAQVARWGRQNQTIEKLRAKRQENIAYYAEELREVTAHKRQRAYCEAGEPVGLLAAQAAGEPSTQMTLNTFHSAGSTVTHVTEGIPRLRELLIYASVKKPAIVVPVEKAGPRDEAALLAILQAAAAVRLVDCLANVEGEAEPNGYRYHIERSAQGFLLTVALLFSKRKLLEKRRAQRMGDGEHLDSFTAALRAFARQVVNELDGRAERGRAGGPVKAAVQDPMELADENEAAAAADESDDNDDNERKEEEEDQPKDAAAGIDEDDGVSSDAGGGSSEDDDGEPAENDEDAAQQKRRNKRPRRSQGGLGAHRSMSASLARSALDEDEDNDDEDAGTQGSSEILSAGRQTPFQSSEALGYDTFPFIHTTFRNKKYMVTITPISPRMAAAEQIVKLPEELFLVNVVIRGPNNVVAVVPDVLERVLHQQHLPSWLPQFDSVSFTRKADDPSSGELVFQGENATMRQVLTFLSLFTVGVTGIQLHKVRSTNIQDMRIALGVESAYQALYDELDKLFRRYAVDYHHLSLIADTATHCGVWENFNSMGVISHSASPLFQMTCAASKKFLHTALIRGVGDDLQSISAAVMVGERPKVGTACVQVIQDTRVLKDVIEKNFA